MRKRILEAHCNIQNMTSLDAKMTYIKAWQQLAASGTAYFIVTFKGSKKKVSVHERTQFMLLLLLSFLVEHKFVTQQMNE